MTAPPAKIDLEQWGHRHAALLAAGLVEPSYGGDLARHLRDGDSRLQRLLFDNSPAALRLWNFLLTEETRLAQARAAGGKLVGVMKDLGTVPVLAYSLPNVTAFYPDGAWWLPCMMEFSGGLLGLADGMGIDDSFCPVRAMLGAFIAGSRFPLPDLSICSVGATCDDFPAIAQYVQDLGNRLLWWEIPARRLPEPGEAVAELCPGLVAPAEQVEFVAGQLRAVAAALEELSGHALGQAELAAGIDRANRVRALLGQLRATVFAAEVAPLPALEVMIAEMLAIHFCSDQAECIAVLEELLAEVRRRVATGQGAGEALAVRVFVVNPSADLRLMNLLESCGGRLAGSDFMFGHALEIIRTDLPPLEALARLALADPMVGPAWQRAERIAAQAHACRAEAVLVTRIPGASHCATEGGVITEYLARTTGLPTAEIEVPPVIDSLQGHLATRIRALVETAAARR
jgi:hypothetical protein